MKNVCFSSTISVNFSCDALVLLHSVLSVFCPLLVAGLTAVVGGKLPRCSRLITQHHNAALHAVLAQLFLEREEKSVATPSGD